MPRTSMTQGAQLDQHAAVEMHHQWSRYANSCTFEATFPKLLEARFSLTIPERPLVCSRPKISRQEGNFWTQRPAAKNPTETSILFLKTHS